MTEKDENKPDEEKGKGTAKAPVLSMKSLKEQLDASNAATEERLTALDGTLGDLDESISAQSQSVNKQFEEVLKAINTPTSIRKDGASSGDSVLVEQERQFQKSDKPEDQVRWMETSRVTDVLSAEFKAKAEQSLFDQELVEVYVQRSQAAFPDNTFTLTVNGRGLVVLRGINQWMPRNYVEIMARARTSTYGNVETVEGATGEMVVKNPETRSHRYAFHMVTDRNKEHGPHWWERVMNERVA